MSNYKQEAITELVKRLIAAGFRVFISKSGTYGFYTDAKGTKVICFQNDLGITSFSGNYKTDKPKETGTGWRIQEGDNGTYYQAIFDSCAPKWAVKDAKYSYTTLEQHLKSYGESSGYVEVT